MAILARHTVEKKLLKLNSTFQLFFDLASFLLVSFRLGKHLSQIAIHPSFSFFGFDLIWKTKRDTLRITLLHILSL